MNEERRYTPATIELRGRIPVIVGYAALFDTLSSPIPSTRGQGFYRERIIRGAFKQSIVAGEDVLARYEHSQLLGRTGNGTLRLREDERGLRYEIDPPNTQIGRDVLELIRRRDVQASSFAFHVRPMGDVWRHENGTSIRELRSVALIDVSPVALASYPQTTVNVHYPVDSVTMTRMRMRLTLAERG